MRERRPQGGLLRRVRAQGALLQGNALACGWRINAAVQFLWERTLCATNLRSGTPQRGCRAQGALPQASARSGAVAILQEQKPMHSEAPL